MEVEGYSVPKDPVDRGSRVKEATAFDLGYTTLKHTDMILRIADQSQVVRLGLLSQIPTQIGRQTCMLNYMIIRVDNGRSFQILLERPWLYIARVVVDWGEKKF